MVRLEQGMDAGLVEEVGGKVSDSDHTCERFCHTLPQGSVIPDVPEAGPRAGGGLICHDLMMGVSDLVEMLPEAFCPAVERFDGYLPMLTDFQRAPVLVEVFIKDRENEA